MDNGMLRILKDYIIAVARKEFTISDTFNNVTIGKIIESLNGNYTVELENSNSRQITATSANPIENFEKEDRVYLLEASVNGSQTFKNYYVFGKVSDVNEEFGKSDWSKFVGAGKLESLQLNSFSSESLVEISEDGNDDKEKSFITSLNQNNYLAIYGTFSCKSKDIKDYGLEIILTYGSGENARTKKHLFNTDYFIGQPFNLAEDNNIIQKRLIKLHESAVNNTSSIIKIEIKNFYTTEDGVEIDDIDKLLSLKALALESGTLYEIPTLLSVKIETEEESKAYLLKEVANDNIFLKAKVTQNGRSVYTNLFNYIWYMNDPAITDEKNEGYWKPLIEPSETTWIDLEGNQLTVEGSGDKRDLLCLYRGTAPEDKPNQYIKINFDDDNSAFNRKIKCEVAYQGEVVESPVFDIYDYKYETYSAEIVSSANPATFYPDDGEDFKIILSAEVKGGPEDGPKYNLSYDWSVDKQVSIIEKNNENKYEEKLISENDGDQKYHLNIDKKSIDIILSKDSYVAADEGKIVIKNTNSLTYNFSCSIAIKNAVGAEVLITENSNAKTVVIATETNVEVQTHYQYYIGGYSGINFTKFYRPNDSSWHGEWQIKNDMENASWSTEIEAVSFARVDYEIETDDNGNIEIENVKYEYEFKDGLKDTEAYNAILNIQLNAEKVLYITSRRVWIETYVDEESEQQKQRVGRQENWSYPIIVKATLKDSEELSDGAIEKLNVFNALTEGGNDQGLFFEDVYILTKDTAVQANKNYYKRTGAGKNDYTEIDLEQGAPISSEDLIYELKKNQVYINAEYIQTGALRITNEEGNQIFYADADNGKVYVDKLSSFSVDMGTVEAGNIQSPGYMKLEVWGDDVGDDELLIPSEGLSFAFNTGGNYYTLNGKGRCEDSDIVIPSVYNDGTNGEHPVQVIDNNFLSNDTEVTSVYIPNGITTISGTCFQNCSKLERVVFGTGVTQLQMGLLSGCSSLKEVIFSASLEKVGSPGVFYKCNVLEKVTLVCPKITFSTLFYHGVPESLKTVVLTGGTEIIANAFSSCNNIEEIAIPQSVTTIGVGAFKRCYSLTSITIPDSVTSIGNDAFLECEQLTKITIGEGITTIGVNAFDGCVKLEELFFNANECNNFGNDRSPFTVCGRDSSNGLRVTFGENVTKIPSYLFKAYNAGESTAVPAYITEVIIPDSVTKIGNFAFMGCNKLEKVYYMGTTTEWGGISIGLDNDSFTDKMYYYSETAPTDTEHKYWHYKDGFKISCNDDNMIDSKYFKVTQDGKIAATEGKIANWVLDKNMLYSNTINSFSLSENGTGMSSTSEPDYPAFWAGYTGIGKNPWEGMAEENWNGQTKFYVTNAGKMVAKNVEIKEEGWIGNLQINNNGLLAKNEDEETILSLSPDGLNLSSKEAKIQVGNLGVYYDNTKEKTYLTTDGSLYIQGKQEDEVITAIQFLTEASGDESRTYQIKCYIQRNSIDVSNKTCKIAVWGKALDSDGNPLSLYQKISFKFSYEIGRNLWGSLLWDSGKGEFDVEIPAGNASGFNQYFSFTYYGALQDHFFRYKINNGDFKNSPTEKMEEFKSAIEEDVETITQTKLKNNIRIIGNIVPQNALYNLGEAGLTNCWNNIYAKTTEVQLSDRNQKNSIEPLAHQYDILFDELNPVRYKFNQNESNRYHIGFISQDVKEALMIANIPTSDFAGYILYDKNDETKGCGLRYGEFIALNTDQIQKLKKRESELEDKVAQLELQIKEIKGEI